MSENLKPKTNQELSLEETQAALPTAAQQPSPAHTPADVTTDFEQSDSAPSNERLGISRAADRGHSVHQLIADYRLDKKLGEGGMGRVFKAIDSQGRAVAIKLLSQHLTRSDEAMLRFKKEGYIASQINHPHCVFVHRVDEDRGTPFIAMELMTGQTLKDLVQQRGGLPYQEAVSLILQCIDGLIEAHRLGMIHRDIKPANCYLDDEGNVKIGDFGLARSLVDDSELTRTGAFLGTPLFASPEQLLGQKIDERSDIYSLSATLYYLLAGRAPFESPNAAQVIAKIASSDPPPFSEFDVKVPAALEAIVMHGLARDRTKRFDSFQKMRAALLPLLAPERQIASLPRRAMAGFLDLCVCVISFRLFLFLLSTLTGIPITDIPGQRTVLTTVGWFLYLWLSEWMTGWTIGKRILKLKIVDSQTGLRPSTRKLLLRTTIFLACMESVRYIHEGFYSLVAIPISSVGTAASLMVGALLTTALWRRSGSKQLTHEWYSQTETCMAVSARLMVSARLDLPEWSLPVRPADNYPAKLGRFTIVGQIPTSSSGEWLLGHDVKLERQVWIHCLTAGSPPISAARKACTSRGRMRVLDSGIDRGRHWDAFMAPDGVPLSVLIQSGIHLPWPIAQHLIAQLLDLTESPVEQLPAVELWDVQRYWLDALGRLTFAEASIDSGQATSAGEPEALFQQVAMAALPPKHRRRRHLNASSHSSLSIPLADLPVYGGLRLLERMSQKALTLNRIRSELTRVNQSPEQVTPSMRFGHALMLTLLLSPFFVALVIFFTTAMMIRVDSAHQSAQLLAAVHQVQEFPERYPMAFAGLEPSEKERWLGQQDIEMVAAKLKETTAKLQVEYANANAFERLVTNALGVNQSVIDGDFLSDEMLKFDATQLSQTQSSKEKTVETEGPVAVVGLGNKRTVKGLLADVAAQKELEIPKRFSNDELDWGFKCLLCTLLFLAAWTGLTRGGLAQLLTGVAIVRRDGRRIGIVRAGLRILLLLSPFWIITYAVVELEATGTEWLWLSSQLKIAFFFMPVFYLVGALIWPQQGPHDRICNTAVVPR